MSWVLAFLGFALLIMLHEFGHFAAAKATGMRVERFSLFFPPHIFKWRPKGSETDYTIGLIPLGGYCKITGMTANEELPEELAYRAYHRQKPWKRIVVIAAGPAMNLLVAFLLLWGLYLANGLTTHHATNRVAPTGLSEPAKSTLRPGDTIVSVDGVHGDATVTAKQVGSHHCAGKPTDGCRATTPAKVVIRRDGKLMTLSIVPRYDATAGIERTRLGFSYEDNKHVTSLGVAGAAGQSVTTMWDVTTGTVSRLARIFDPNQRKQISGVVGGYEATREAFNFDTTQALFILALISLSLAVVNLFPFLPLDGGHMFWALAEKVRGRPIPFSVMERASVVGFVLIVFIAFIGLSNDIGRLTSGEGFHLR
jgi:regulator of sigma E protease